MNGSFFVCNEYIGFILVWIGYGLLDEVTIFILDFEFNTGRRNSFSGFSIGLVDVELGFQCIVVDVIEVGLLIMFDLHFKWLQGIITGNGMLLDNVGSVWKPIRNSTTIFICSKCCHFFTA